MITGIKGEKDLDEANGVIVELEMLVWGENQDNEQYSIAPTEIKEVPANIYHIIRRNFLDIHKRWEGIEVSSGNAMTYKDYLKNIYYDPNHPGSYSGLDKLSSCAKRRKICVG